MNVWVLHFRERDFTQQMYEKGFSLIGPESQRRIKRFYHKGDSYRCLLGRLLPLLLLKRYGVSPKDAIFGRTSTGKPFICNSIQDHSIGFNISHDNGYVVMAHQILDEPASSMNPQSSIVAASEIAASAGSDSDAAKESLGIGIDVMKVALPRYEEDIDSFVEHVSDTLTPLEKRILLEKKSRTKPNDNEDEDEEGENEENEDEENEDEKNEDEKNEDEKNEDEEDDDEEDDDEEDDDEDEEEELQRLQHLFFIWTMKEAYTKALGLGLGFDFRRLEVNPHERRITVDGEAPPEGWEFGAFMLEANTDGGADSTENEGGEKELYQIAIVRRIPACAMEAGSSDDGDSGRIELRDVSGEAANDWLKHLDAMSLIEGVADAA